MKDYEQRINDPRMEYYREVYKDSRRWDGDDFQGKKVIIYMEQGIGDQLMFLRFIRFVKEKGATPILHAPITLHRLINNMGYECFDKEESTLPDHDFHILSLSLPMVLQCPIPLEPYIKVAENYDADVDKTKINIGIAWEGNPQHESNQFRSCPFNYFLPLFRSDVDVWGAAPTVPEGNYDVSMSFIDYTDFYETAKLYNSMDVIVSVDTSAIHLAGAMGKPTYMLAGNVFMDPRWQGMWYPTVKILKGRWNESIGKVLTLIPSAPRCKVGEDTATDRPE